jgi:formylglycine-generating enzyme required for sulfatase activity
VKVRDERGLHAEKTIMKRIKLPSQYLHLIAGLLLCTNKSTAETESPAGLSIQVFSGLSITGTVARVYQVQYANQLSDSATWYGLTQFPLRWNPHQWVDTTCPATERRFYRAFAVELPADVAPITNMVFIAPGTFIMGSPAAELARDSDEGPQTLVTISRAFWMGKYEVTQGEYLELIGENPSFFNGVQDSPEPGTDYGTDLRRPVEQVTGQNAIDYCSALTSRERAAGRLSAKYEYRLPTEAEWEYACRAGTTTPFYFGAALRSGMANFNAEHEYPPCGADLKNCENPAGENLQQPVAVGSYPANPWGLHDMIGNVSERCLDWYAPYSGVAVVDPKGPATGNVRTARGSSWKHPAFFLRSALRDYAGPSYKGNYTGFRVVLAPVL